MNYHERREFCSKISVLITMSLGSICNNLQLRTCNDSESLVEDEIYKIDIVKSGLEKHMTSLCFPHKLSNGAHVLSGDRAGPVNRAPVDDAPKMDEQVAHPMFLDSLHLRYDITLLYLLQSAAHSQDTLVTSVLSIRQHSLIPFCLEGDLT